MANKVVREKLCEPCRVRYDNWIDARRLRNKETAYEGRLITIREVNDLLDTFMRHQIRCDDCEMKVID
jgi:hypothetical protein